MMSDYELRHRFRRIERLLQTVLERLPGDPQQLAELTSELAGSESELRTALDSADPQHHAQHSHGERTMAAELDALKSQVRKNTDAEASAATLLGGLKKLLDDAIASGDPAALTKLSNDLGTSQQALAKAVTDNTPATPSPGSTGRKNP